MSYKWVKISSKKLDEEKIDVMFRLTPRLPKYRRLFFQNMIRISTSVKPSNEKARKIKTFELRQVHLS